MHAHRAVLAQELEATPKGVLQPASPADLLSMLGRLPCRPKGQVRLVTAGVAARRAWASVRLACSARCQPTMNKLRSVTAQLSLAPPSR